MIQEIALSLLLVKGSFGMSYASQIRTVKTALIVIQHDTGVKITIKRIRKTTDRFPAFRTLDTRYSRFAQFQSYLFQKRWYNREGINLIVDVPIIDSGKRYIAGIASRRCRPFGGFAIAQVQDLNQNFEDRQVQSVIAVAHEVAHLIGADHHEGTTIMNIGASGLSPLPTGFDGASIKEIRECLN